MNKPKNILVTGATGFVGANLVHRLVKSNNKIHIVLRRTSDTWRIKDILSKVNLHYADLINAREIDVIVKKIEPQVIYHLATYGAYPFQKNDKKIFQANVFGTMNLLNACAKVGFDAFINTGSSSEYGVKQKPMSENNLLEPTGSYGLAKVSQTLFCQQVAKEKKLPVVTLRLFSPFGPYEESTRLMPVLINSCLRNKDLNLVSPKTVRDFSFVDDVVDAYLKTSTKADKLSGQIINIANGQQRALKDVVGIIMKLTDTKSQANWGEMKDYSPNTAKWVADINKSKKMIDWHPKYNLEDGLKETVSWFKKNHKNFSNKYVIR